jgi:hypothetical protein
VKKEVTWPVPSDTGAAYMPTEEELTERIAAMREKKLADKRAQACGHNAGPSGIRIIPTLVNRRGRNN